MYAICSVITVENGKDDRSSIGGFSTFRLEPYYLATLCAPSLEASAAVIFFNVLVTETVTLPSLEVQEDEVGAISARDAELVEGAGYK